MKHSSIIISQSFQYTIIEVRGTLGEVDIREISEISALIELRNYIDHHVAKLLGDRMPEKLINDIKSKGEM